jgi:transposase
MTAHHLRQLKSQAPTPSPPIQQTGPGATRHVLASNYQDDLALHRLSQIYARGGLDLLRAASATRQTVRTLTHHLADSRYVPLCVA